jgi:FtsP/CotA-like multicopper oxidase with cupredoxin domain
MKGMLANGKGLTIVRFDIDTEVTADDITLYTSLPSTAEINTRLTEADATNTTVRKFVMSMGGMGNMGGGNMGSSTSTTPSTTTSTTPTDTNASNMQGMNFVINGKIFDPKKVNEFIAAGATEVWSIRNMSPMAHPFHAHAIQYQILSRNNVAATGTDLGWKDTFLVQPGQTVKVIGKFEAINTGDYMYHCHILEHEDAGMMGYFRVGDTGQLGAQ